MSGVVLRCPNCGTTRAAPGECDACHEAAVRYYCSNHTPGRWLDSGSCPVCGDTFGNAARPPATRPAAVRPPAAPVPPAARPPAGRARRPAGTPAPRGPAPAMPPAPVPAWPSPPPSGRTDAFDDRIGIDDDGRWDPAARSPPPLEVVLAPAGRALRGCLFRLMALIVFAVLLLFAGVSMLGGSLLRIFGIY